MVDALEVLRAGTADKAMHRIAFLKQPLGQVAAVLARDPGDDRFFHWVLASCLGLGIPAAAESLRSLGHGSILPLVVFLVLPVTDVRHPLVVLPVPAHRVDQALLERNARSPAQLALDFAGVNCI